VSPQVRPRARSAPADVLGAGRDPLGLEGVFAFLGLDGGGWHHEALCVGRTEPVDHWFAEVRHDPKRRDGWAPAFDVAVAHCMACPVIEECLRSALTPAPRWSPADARPEAPARTAAEWGVFGGTIPGDRRGKTLEDVPELLAMARARAIERGLAPRRPKAQVETETVFSFGRTAGPGRGHKGPAAIYAERHGVSLPTARKRLRLVAV
jgi:hypothetical protein